MDPLKIMEISPELFETGILVREMTKIQHCKITSFGRPFPNDSNYLREHEYLKIFCLEHRK